MPRSPESEMLFFNRRFHALKRLQERYGLHLDFNEYAFINLQIRKRKCKRVADLPGRCAAYHIEFRGRTLIAAYSHHDHPVITFYPPGHQFPAQTKP